MSLGAPDRRVSPRRQRSTVPRVAQVDDDAVLVLGSARRTVACPAGSFDEELPKELLGAMSRGDAVARMSDAEGRHSVTVELVEDNPAGATGAFVLVLDVDPTRTAD